MKHRFQVIKRWSLAIASAATLTIGAMALLSCGGEGGPIGSGGGGGGGGNSYTAQFMALLPAGQAGATYVGADTCKTCHNGVAGSPGGRVVGSEAYYDEWSGTKHHEKNVTCENCHGPGSKHAAAPSADTILTAPRSNSPIICAQCHGPIYDQWKDTGHAEIIEHPVADAATSPGTYGRSSRCIQCHSGLFRTETAEKGVDVGAMTDQQIIDFSAQALDESNKVKNIANCATCHNPHKTTGPDNLTWEGTEAQLRHPPLNTDPTNIGPSQTAANFVNFNQICAQCHNGRGTDPSDAKLQTNTSRPGGHSSDQYNMLMGVSGVEGSGPVQRNMAHATAPGQCSHCHMPNANHSYTVSYDISCQPCHTGAGAAANANSVKTQIINAEYALLTRLQNWSKAHFSGDPDMWEFTTIISGLGKTPPSQSLIPIEIKRARYNYHFILIDNSMGPHNFPYMTTLIDVANINLTTAGAPLAPAPGRAADLTTAQKLQVLRAQQALAKNAELLPD